MLWRKINSDPLATFENFFELLFICVECLCLRVCLCTICMLCPWGPEEGVRLAETKG